jgi:TonB family protein
VAQELVRDRSNRKKWSAVIAGSIAALALTAALVPSAHAQKAVRLPRRVVVNVTPEYPVSLRAAHIGGMVRLNVTVSPAGDVVRIELLGGNAILADSATKAVTKWKYAPSGSETTNEVQMRFNPDSPNTR